MRNIVIHPSNFTGMCSINYFVKLYVFYTFSDHVESEGKFAHWDAAIIIVDTPFDIGIPYANPICLQPPSKVGKETEWDGELFGALGMYVSSALWDWKFFSHVSIQRLW